MRNYFSILNRYLIQDAGYRGERSIEKQSSGSLFRERRGVGVFRVLGFVYQGWGYGVQRYWRFYCFSQFVEFSGKLFVQEVWKRVFGRQSRWEGKGGLRVQGYEQRVCVVRVCYGCVVGVQQVCVVGMQWVYSRCVQRVCVVCVCSGCTQVCVLVVCSGCVVGVCSRYVQVCVVGVYSRRMQRVFVVGVQWVCSGCIVGMCSMCVQWVCVLDVCSGCVQWVCRGCVQQGLCYGRGFCLLIYMDSDFLFLY